MAGSDLVAKLGVDSSQWTAGFQQARSTASSFGSSLSSILSPQLAAVGGAIAGVWGAGASVDAYRGALEEQRRLAAVLEATGGAAGLTTDQIGDFANEMKTLTNYEAGAVVAASGVLAAFTNIREQTFTDTIKSAMDLATVMGGDLESNVKLLGKALNDPAEGFTKLAKAGVTFTDAQQEQIKAMQESGDLMGAQQALLDGIQSKFGGAAEAVADPWTQLKNQIGDLGENIGSLLLPSINVLSDAMNGIISVAVDAGDAFLELGIEAAVVLENMGGILNLTMLNWQLFFVQVGAEAAHLFTETMPAYIVWFGDNWQELIITAASNTLTVFENLGTNIQSVWQSVLDYFAGKPLTFDWKPLTDGFINTVQALPDIPPRAIGELEQGLQSSIAAATDALGQSMTESRDRIAAQFDTSARIPAGTIVPDAEAGGGKAEKEKENKASILGSKEAAQIMLRGIGSANDIPTKQLKVAEQQLEATQQVATAIGSWQQPAVADF